MKKVIMDVDTGIDDALAIMYGLESDALEFLGITTVDGNVPLDMVNRNTLKVLSMLGREDVPVFSGAAGPLMKPSRHVHHIHGEDGLGGALIDYPYENMCEAQFAPDFIVEAARHHPGEVTLIAVGPLTNVALAFKQEPLLGELLKEVVIMGGIVSRAGQGNSGPNSEFNIFTDAEAARIVIHGGANVTLVGLDVTKQAVLTARDIETLKGSKYYDFIKQSTEIYRTFSMDKFGLDGCALHDPLAVGFALNRGFLRTEHHYVDVDTVSPLNYGQTVCDFGGLWGEEPNVNVSLEVDSARFVEDFLNVMKNASGKI
ncbi:nucleoside hydrolase [Salinicoccus jeotgali]|uniref:Nucleoside hydrolase n=1 Tax=Salinicoccus jeotgali TaxID=381634 RepID=A0ABP7F512_9STAP